MRQDNIKIQDVENHIFIESISTASGKLLGWKVKRDSDRVFRGVIGGYKETGN